jgi:hypothetical protein
VCDIVSYRIRIHEHFHLDESRYPTGTMSLHGPADSAALARKIWIAEDDTRTNLADEGLWLRNTPTDWETVAQLRRNMFTAMLRKQGLYWLDLMSRGWFGRTDNASTIATTAAIWGNASLVLKQWQRLLTNATLQKQSLPPPAIAIFVDEKSSSARPLKGKGGSPDGQALPGYHFENALLRMPWQTLASIGAPVRVYLMTDLLRSEFPVEHIRLAVMLNAFIVSPEVRAAVRTKLQTGGRTIVWSYTPGIFVGASESDSALTTFGSTAHTGHTGPAGPTGSKAFVVDSMLGHRQTQAPAPATLMPSSAAASDLTGLPLRFGIGNAPSSLLSTFMPGVMMPVGSTGHFGGEFGPVSPWMYCGTDTGLTVEVGARYTDGTASVVRANIAMHITNTTGGTNSTDDHTAVFIGTPGAPAALWRAIAGAAGVHLFTAPAANAGQTTATFDTVEVGGAGLLYIAGTHSPSSGNSSGSTRQVKLPGMYTVTAESGNVICSFCDTFQTPVLRGGENALFWLSV